MRHAEHLRGALPDALIGPQPSVGSITTRVPAARPCTPSPCAATVPTPSEPGMHGSWIPG